MPYFNVNVLCSIHTFNRRVFELGTKKKGCLISAQIIYYGDIGMSEMFYLPFLFIFFNGLETELIKQKLDLFVDTLSSRGCCSLIYQY